MRCWLQRCCWWDSYKNLLFLGVVFCNLVIGTVQEIRAKRTVDKLSLLSAAGAHVIRGGKKRTVPLEEVVLDDILELTSGGQICGRLCDPQRRMRGQRIAGDRRSGSDS